MLKDALRHPVKRGVLGICLAAFINALAGCAEVPATNPYDPTTPVAQQAKATIKGLITLPEGDEDLSVFDAGVVLLYPPTLVLARDTVCRTTEQMRAERRAELTATDQIGAQFEFTELPHGQYVLVTCVTGYLTTIERVTAERGTATSYTISLEQVPQETLNRRAVRLEGQADEQHGDVRVETRVEALLP